MGVTTAGPPIARRTRRMGLTRLGEIPPRPIAGVVQRQVRVDPDRPLAEQLPARCDKCGNPRLALAGREVQCRGVMGGCGRTWYLVSGAPLTRAEIPSERTRYRMKARARAGVA
jgi:hypothetical protein